MDKIFVLLAVAFLISFIVWWFLVKRQSSQSEATMVGGAQEVEVVVDGGYTPNVVMLRKGVPATIIFKRKTTSGCFDEVVFPDFGISERLPVNRDFPIVIDTSKTGEFGYACGMNMFHGKVVVK